MRRAGNESLRGEVDFIRKLNGAATFWDSTIKEVNSPRLPPLCGELETAAGQRLLDAGLLEDTGGQLGVVKNHAAYLRGSWLEEYCYAIGRQLESDAQHRMSRARFQINVMIDPFDRARVDKYPLNELDAAFVHRNRMLIVECKTGSQLGQDGKSQTILNKLEVLGEHAAGRFASKLVLTTEDSINTATAERAKRYGIVIVTARELPRLRQHIIDWMDK